MTEWSQKERDYLLKNYSKLTLVEMSSKLKRPITETRGQANTIVKELKEWAAIASKTKTKQVPGVNAAYRGGIKKDLGPWKFRSGWECNFARYLNHKGIPWTYEETRFIFQGIKQRNTRSYTPDFHIYPGTPQEKFIEVKGFLRNHDITKIKRLSRYYPEEFKKLVCVPGSANTQAAKFFAEMDVPVFAYYYDLQKEYQDTLPHWGE